MTPPDRPFSDRPQIETLVQDDDLQIRRLPGSGAGLVLVFTGVKHGLGGVPLDEFVGTAQGGAGNHVLFISDMKRTWYSRAGLVDRVLRLVTDYCAHHGLSRIQTLGNSMGGYGALLFCRFLPVDLACAISPQISMHPDRITERRWSQHRVDFGPDLAHNAAEGFGALPTRAVVLYGHAESRDRAQMRLIPALPNLTQRGLRGCGHDVARRLKNAGLYRHVFSAILTDDMAGLDRICTDFEHRLSNRLRHLQGLLIGGLRLHFIRA